MDEGGDPAGTVHQDPDRPSRRFSRHPLGRKAGLGNLPDVSRPRIDRRGLSDILGGGLLRGAGLVQIQPGMGRPLASGISVCGVSAAIATEALILAKAAAQGIKYQPGWILGTAATLKVFI